MKKGAYNKQRESSSDRQTKYITNLSDSVRKACDVWLEERGLKTGGWRKQKDEDYKRRENGRKHN